MTEPEQVLGRGDRPLQVLRVDGRQGRRLDVVVDRDDGRAERLVDAARRDEDRAVCECAADPREVAPFPAGLVGRLAAAGEDDELVARVADTASDSLEQLGAERLEVAHEHADHLRAAAAQALTDEARVVAEGVDHGAHPGGGVLGDAVAVVDHLRDRRDRDPRLRGDVTDRHASVLLALAHGSGLY